MPTEIKILYDKFKESGKISTDTRKITRGSVFFALKGEKYNGNEFAAEALADGASYAVVDDAKWVIDKRCILVSDVLQTLQELARFHRDQFIIPVLALTGSNGKTTAKELIRAVLSKKYKVLATEGNLNNHIGVPLTILAIDVSTEIAVIEMGANHVGEIAALCEIANPTHGFINNIGKAHIGTFGGFENVIRGKSELYQHLIKHHGTVWINSADPILANMSKRFEKPFFYPSKGDYYHCKLISANPYLKIETENEEELLTQLIGEYNFDNVAIALCIGKFFQVDSADAKKAIEDYIPSNMRSQFISKGTNTVILDAYNANPSSMELAIKSLSLMKAKKKIAILGDMYELGDESEVEHKKIATWIKEYKIDAAFLCGVLIKSAVQTGLPLHYFSTKEQLCGYLKANPIDNATILVKASRGMALESVINYL